MIHFYIVKRKQDRTVAVVACAAQSSSSVRLASVQQMMAGAGVMVLIRFNQLRYVLYGFEVST